VLGKIRFVNYVISPYIIAGPRLDILAGREIVLETPIYLAYQGFADLVGGITIGGGVELTRIAARSIILEIRYNIDLNRSYYMVWPEPIEGFLYFGEEFSNESIDVSIGVGF
jgi:hypothetical protein